MSNESKLSPVKVFIPVKANEGEPIHLLKEQSLYVFNREELEGLLKDTFDAGINYKRTSGYIPGSVDVTLHPNKTEYIQSLF